MSNTAATVTIVVVVILVGALIGWAIYYNQPAAPTSVNQTTNTYSAPMIPAGGASSTNQTTPSTSATPSYSY
jgi:hypothetical protein